MKGFVQFLIVIVFASIALAILPSLVQGKGGLLALGIILAFFVLPAIGTWVLNTFLGSLWGFLALAAIVFFFVNNQRSCSSSQLPLGDVGQVTDLARVGYFAESDYDRCLAGYVNTESAGNQLLATAARQCVANANVYVNSCMTQIQNEWWVLDKAGVCRDQASKNVWRSCATMAMQTYAADNGNLALGACQAKTVNISLMRTIAGMLSGMSSTTDATTTPQNTTNYDTGCLVTAFNSNLGYMPQTLHCEQYTARQIDSQGERMIATDLAKYQDCLARSIVQGLGDAGTRLVNSCQVPAR